MLSGGRSGRFYEQLVRQKQLATGANAGKGESRGPGMFRVSATVAPGKAVADVEAALYEEIERVKAAPPAQWEMDKARATARRNYVQGVQSSLNRAIQLSQLALFFNDPDLLNTRPDRIAAVTAADVQRVAMKYLTTENRTVVITNPKPAAGRGGN